MAGVLGGFHAPAGVIPFRKFLVFDFGTSGDSGNIGDDHRHHRLETKQLIDHFQHVYGAGIAASLKIVNKDNELASFGRNFSDQFLQLLTNAP